MAIIRGVVLLRTDVSSLRKANEALSKHHRAKKTRVKLGEAATMQNIQKLLDQTRMPWAGRPRKEWSRMV